MDSIAVKDWQLLSLFEVEPELREPGERWEFNDAVYRVVQGDLTLSFAIAPHHRDVRVILEHGGHRVYELNAVAVLDLWYRQEGSVEELETLLTERDRITLRVKPRITLEHSLRLAD